MTLWALTLRLVLLALLILRNRRARAKSLRAVETALRRLGDSARLRPLADTALTNTDANASTDVLDTCIGLVDVLRGATAGTLAERWAGLRTSRLAERHETLHSLAAGTVQ